MKFDSNDELQAKRNDLQSQLGGARGDRRDNLAAAIGAIDQEVAARDQAQEALERLADDPRNTPEGSPYLQPPAGHTPRWRTPATRTPVGDRESPETQRKLAYLLVGDLERDGILNTAAADRLADVVDSDEIGTDALYLRSISDPAYESSFSKLLQFGAAAPARFTEDESRAAAAVFRAQSLRASIGGYRAAGLDTGTPGGGYAVPITLDPTIISTSTGAVSPLRQLARTVTLAGSNEWRGVSSDGVEASFAPEGDEVGDDTPTLSQPVVHVEKAHCFVPYSIELESDFGTLRTELTRMLTTAVAELEADRFLYGGGSAASEPEGLVSAGTAAGTAVVIQTGGTTLATEDVYKIQESVVPRFQTGAVFLGSNTMRNNVRRLVGSADPTEPQLFDPTGQNLLGKRFYETSGLPTTVTSGENILVYGDVSSFLIADRIGLQVDVVQHLMGENKRPVGFRGLYAWWRVGSGLLTSKAVKILQVKT